VLLSDTGYINERLGVKYLEYFILYIKASFITSVKFLLMDSYISYCAPEFVLLAHQHHIILYTFPSHLTHVMQPLDVGVFQLYKHWYKKVIQHAMYNLDISYNIVFFLRDLTEIRYNTFKIGTVKNAWKKAGIWPLNCKQTLANMKIYTRESQTSKLSIFIFITPRKFVDSERGF
jgi:hypothetical protein